MAFNFQNAIRALADRGRYFDAEGYVGSGSYADPIFGEILFSFTGNRGNIQINWNRSSIWCTCGDITECGCDWEWEEWANVESRTFTEKRFVQIVSQHRLDL